MPKPAPIDPTKIAQSIKTLAASAAELNAASDELSGAIAPIDTALKKLNVGIEVWYQYAGAEDPAGDYWGRRIGYARINGRWGLGLSTISGNLQFPENSSVEEWLFNDAPRKMRLEAIDHVPMLLDVLVREVSKAAIELKRKSKQAREIAETISAVSIAVSERR